MHGSTIPLPNTPPWRGAPQKKSQDQLYPLGLIVIVIVLPVGVGNFLHHFVQYGSGAYPASYPMGTRGSFPGGKAAEA
jgi:hypothetical protein